MNEPQRPDEDREGSGRRAETRIPAFDTSPKSRPTYFDPGGSQSTKELRETARRRREAEEKLQQHLMEAKEHAHHDAGHHPTGGPDVAQGHEDRQHDGQRHD